MTILFFIFGFVLGIGALIFALQNTAVVTLSFMGWQFESSLALLVVVTLVVGMLISALALLPSAIAESIKIMSLKNENKKLVEELEKKQHALVAAQTAAANSSPHSTNL